MRRYACTAIVAYRFLEYRHSPHDASIADAQEAIAYEIETYRGFYHIALELLLNLGADLSDEKTHEFFKLVADKTQLVQKYATRIDGGGSRVGGGEEAGSSSSSTEHTEQTTHNFHTARMAYASALVKPMQEVCARTAIEVTMTARGFENADSSQHRYYKVWASRLETLLVEYETALAARSFSVELADHTAWSADQFDGSAITHQDNKIRNDKTTCTRAKAVLTELYAETTQRRGVRHTRGLSVSGRGRSAPVEEDDAPSSAMRLVLQRGNANGAARIGVLSPGRERPSPPVLGRAGGAKDRVAQTAQSNRLRTEQTLTFPNEATGLRMWGDKRSVLLSIVQYLWEALEKSPALGCYGPDALSSAEIIDHIPTYVWTQKTRDVAVVLAVVDAHAPTLARAPYRESVLSVFANVIHQEDAVAVEAQLLVPVVRDLENEVARLESKYTSFVVAARDAYEDADALLDDNEDIHYLGRAYAIAANFAWYVNHHTSNYAFENDLSEKSPDDTMRCMVNIKNAVGTFLERFNRSWYPLLRAAAAATAAVPTEKTAVARSVRSTALSASTASLPALPGIPHEAMGVRPDWTAMSQQWRNSSGKKRSRTRTRATVSRQRAPSMIGSGRVHAHTTANPDATLHTRERLAIEDEALSPRNRPQPRLLVFADNRRRKAAVVVDGESGGELAKSEASESSETAETDSPTSMEESSGGELSVAASC